MKEIKCEACGIRPAVKNDILCQECSSRYATLLQSVNKISDDDDHVVHPKVPVIASAERGQVTQAFLEKPASEKTSSDHLENVHVSPSGHQKKRKQSSKPIGYALLGIGLISLAVSVIVTSTILAFIGLGLAFWGVLAFYVHPEKQVPSDLMNATAMSSMKSIDNMMMGMGYRESGVYIPTRSEKAVVFVPSEPFSKIPEGTAVEGKTFLNDPQGLLVVPPGLALSALIEKKLGFDLKNCGLEKLVHSLPKALIDLEIVRDAEIKVSGDQVDFRLVDSIYSDFCKQVRDDSRPCALGCPMCSALACILAIASGKPVLFKEDKLSNDKKTTESSYRLVNEQRL